MPVTNSQSETNKKTNKTCEIFACEEKETVKCKCGKNVCGKCLLHTIIHCDEYGFFVKCPFCNLKLKVSNYNIKTFMLNHDINHVNIKSCFDIGEEKSIVLKPCSDYSIRECYCENSVLLFNRGTKLYDEQFEIEKHS